MKKIFLTGADGFIGSHLLERLVKEKYKVKALCSIVEQYLIFVYISNVF